MPKDNAVRPYLQKPSSRPCLTIRPRNFDLSLGKKTHIMGIINLTPDSFSGDGRLTKNKNDLGGNLAYAKKLIREGADMIDIGGESSRPGADPITVEEELSRIIPTIKKLAPKITIPISVDTYKPRVAQHALDAGASIINNIMGTKKNKQLLRMVKNYEAAIVLMHIRGNPQTMQSNIQYTNLMTDIKKHLRKSIENCLEIGIKSDKIIIDPGIGFGKTVQNNLTILNRLADFQTLGQPILIGTSRKSFIGHILETDEKNRLIGTISSVCISVAHGAHIVRVHDVKKTKEAVDMADAILKEQP